MFSPASHPARRCRPRPASFLSTSLLLLFQLVLLQLLLQPWPIIEAAPLNQFHANRLARQSAEPLLGQRPEQLLNNGDHQERRASPPHCTRATVTLAHSSRLTKRAPPAHPNSSARGANGHSTQLSLNIGIGQTVCFTAISPNGDSAGSKRSEEAENSDSHEETTAQTITEPKSNFSFIVALARQRRPSTGQAARHRARLASQRRRAGGEAEGGPVLHSITVLDLEQYHAITERYRFAIPELETRCHCECESGTANCAAERYKYGQCEDGDENGSATGDQQMASEFDSTERRSAGLSWAQKGGRPEQKPFNQQPERPSVCHRTFFANQPTGRHCSQRGDQRGSSTARLCCQLRFRAYRNRAFSALRLESAVSSVLLQYSQWAWQPAAADSAADGRRQKMGNGTAGEEEEEERENETKKSAGSSGQQNWVELERRKVRVQLDGAVHNTVLSEEAGLKLSVLGLSGAKSAGAQLEPGVYFAEHQADGSLGELAGQMAVNRITEHDFHKLGWLRLDERGNPFVQSGEVFLERIHHARVEDCAEQRFRSVLDASYYVNADNNASTQFRLSDPLSSVHKWIRSARVLDSHQRIALVQAREGLSLEVTLTASQRAEEEAETGSGSGSRESAGQRLITFVHNSSRLTDFTPLLVIDRFSNSMLNLTLFNASGVLNGFVRSLNDPEASEIDGFTVNVPDEGGEVGSDTHWPVSVQVRIKPYPLGSIHVICLRPDDADLTQELCRPVQSVYHELEVNTVRNEWSRAVGDCPQCNQITAEGFAKYLNPANWVKGFGSVSDALMLVSDIIVYFLAFLIVYALLTKVVFPVLGCCCASCGPSLVASLFRKGSKK